MEDKQRIREAYDLRLISNKYNYADANNRPALNSLGVIKWATLFEVELNENSKRDVWFYEELGRFLMTYGWKVTNVNELGKFSKMGRPEKFDLKKMLIEGGLHEEAERLKNLDDYKLKRKLDAVSGMGAYEVLSAWKAGIRTPEDLLQSLKSGSWSPKNEDWIAGMIKYVELENGVETSFSYDMSVKLSKMLVYTLKKDPPKISGKISIEDCGSGAGEREGLHDKDGIVYKEKWLSGELQTFMEWLPGKHTIEINDDGETRDVEICSAVFFFKDGTSMEREEFSDKPSSTEGIAWAQVALTVQGRNYSTDLWFADQSNIAAIRTLTHSSASFSDALIRFAQSKNMRLNGRGIHREEVWKNGGDPIAVTTEEGVFGLLGLEYIAAADRRADLAKDELPWSGLEEELYVVKLQERKKELGKLKREQKKIEKKELEEENSRKRRSTGEGNDSDDETAEGGKKKKKRARGKGKGKAREEIEEMSEDEVELPQTPSTPNRTRQPPSTRKNTKKRTTVGEEGEEGGSRRSTRKKGNGGGIEGSPTPNTKTDVPPTSTPRTSRSTRVAAPRKKAPLPSIDSPSPSTVNSNPVSSGGSRFERAPSGSPLSDLESSEERVERKTPGKKQGGRGKKRKK